MKMKSCGANSCILSSVVDTNDVWTKPPRKSAGIGMKHGGRRTRLHNAGVALAKRNANANANSNSKASGSASRARKSKVSNGRGSDEKKESRDPEDS
mmetsp:Transcript_5402/g.8024  ORF Transcript_5402/g.8024 Transcript_5402/m.8024 type:complete len:97 (+) Transcript_5402:106-396(+)